MPKPVWLKKRLQPGGSYRRMIDLLEINGLHTVCQEAKCPNQGECFSSGTATFLIMGDCCTRSCGFCAIRKGKPSRLDPAEPERVAKAVLSLGLRHVVVTSVTRDDLPDGGADHFAKTILAIRAARPEATVEVLIPDFNGSINALEKVMAASPRVINHNIETVPRLYRQIRPQASYVRSLGIIRRISRSRPDIKTKSGLMLGLGEKKEEVLMVMSDLLEAGCNMLTMGQYLQPSRQHCRVVRFLHPEEFSELKEAAEELGFEAVAAAPFVRSSYQAAEMIRFPEQAGN